LFAEGPDGILVAGLAQVSQIEKRKELLNRNRGLGSRDWHAMSGKALI